MALRYSSPSCPCPGTALTREPQFGYGHLTSLVTILQKTPDSISTLTHGNFFVKRWCSSATHCTSVGHGTFSFFLAMLPPCCAWACCQQQYALPAYPFVNAAAGLTVNLVEGLP